MVGTEWNQRNMPGPLYGRGHRALVLGANPGLAAGLYLPSVRHIPAKAVGILIVNVFDMVNAEAAYLSTAIVARPSVTEPASATTGSATTTAARTVSASATTGSATTTAARTVSASATTGSATTTAATAGTVSTTATTWSATAATWPATTTGTVSTTTAAWAVTASRWAAGSRTLIWWSSGLLRRHVNSPSATWNKV
jgi:cytoskeletal protein RodZ